MSWLGRSLGEFGSEIGQAHDIGLDWRAREQALRLNEIKNRVEQLMLPLRIKEINEQIRQYGLPQFEGVEKLPGGGLGILERAPDTGLTGMRTLLPGLDRNAAKKQIGTWAASVPPANRSFFDALTASLDDPSTDPLKAVDEAEKYAAKVTESRIGKGTAKLLFRGEVPFGISDPATGEDYYTDDQGRLHAADGGPAPEQFRNLFASAYRAYQKSEQDKYDMLQKRGQQAEARQLRQFQQQREMAARKAGLDAVIAQNRLSDSLDAAKTPSNPNDLLIIENFMQLSFGQQPRGIRGSPSWFEDMRRMTGGSLGQRFEGWLTALQGGGMLGDDARKQLLASIKMLVKNRVQAGITASESYVPGMGVPGMPDVNIEDTAPPPATTGAGGGPPPPPGFSKKVTKP